MFRQNETSLGGVFGQPPPQEPRGGRRVRSWLINALLEGSFLVFALFSSVFFLSCDIFLLLPFLPFSPVWHCLVFFAFFRRRPPPSVNFHPDSGDDAADPRGLEAVVSHLHVVLAVVPPPVRMRQLLPPRPAREAGGAVAPTAVAAGSCGSSGRSGRQAAGGCQFARSGRGHHLAGGRRRRSGHVGRHCFHRAAQARSVPKLQPDLPGLIDF